MKLLDDVRVIVDKEEYKKAGIKKNMIGTIIDADIRWNSFFVCFQDQRVFDKDFMNKEENVFSLNKDICIGIKIEDLELVKDNNCSDETIEKSLPETHKNCWCKVEDGFIVNLLGEKKNKIAYDYNS